MITNCMVLTEGFDSQPVGCITILRPMLHRGTFIQAIGRGLRKVDPERFPGIIKTNCIVLDFAGAAQRHGSIDGDGTSLRTRTPMALPPTRSALSCNADVPRGTICCPLLRLCCGNARPARSPRWQSFPADRDRPAGQLSPSGGGT